MRQAPSDGFGARRRVYGDGYARRIRAVGEQLW
jgi:hypothetical protein